MRTGLMLSFLLMFLSVGWSDSATPLWFSKNAANQVNLRVDLFLTSTCPHCQEVDKFFKSLESTMPWVETHRYFINQDKSALETFNQYLQQKHASDFMVPSIYFCNSRWVGFQDPEKSGPALLRGLNYCHDQIMKNGQISLANEQVLTQMAYEASVITPQSVLTFLPMMALVDALNYPVLYSILVLFAFLMIQKNRADQIATIILFLLGTGIAHHAQQVHTQFYYETLVAFRWPVVLLGFGLIAYVVAFHKRGLAKKQTMVSFLSLLVVVLTAVAVQLYQQHPSPNFLPDYSVIFQQWLLSEHYSSVRQTSYEILYQVMYLMVIALLALVLVFLSKVSKRGKKHLEFLTEFSWEYLVIIGLILILSPALLTEGAFVFVTILLGGVTTWLSFKIWK
jgi:hypothetical protein